MFESIQQMEYNELGYFTTVLDAELLSNEMLSEGRNSRNLNTISHDTAIDLIQKVLDQGINVRKVILDTVGQPDKYRYKLEGIFNRKRNGNPIEIIVESKADANHPVVSAASICAKVVRDKTLEEWKF